MNIFSDSPTGPDILLDNQITSELMLKYPEEIPDLTCNARGGNPAANLFWILDDNKTNGNEEVIDIGNDKKTTVLHWNLPFNFTKDKNFAILQCVAQHPGFHTLYRLTEVIVTMASKFEKSKHLPTGFIWNYTQRTPCFKF